MADPIAPEGVDDAELLKALTADELEQMRRQILLEELDAAEAAEADQVRQTLTPQQRAVLEEGYDPLTASKEERAAALSARKKLQQAQPYVSPFDEVPFAGQIIDRLPLGTVLREGVEESLYQTGRSIAGTADAVTGLVGADPMTSRDDFRRKRDLDPFTEGAAGIAGYFASFALNSLLLKKIGIANTLVRGFGAGAITDAFQVDPYAAGIGDLMEQYVPGADKSAWVDWFSSDNKEDDSVWEARFKSLAEGGLIGGTVESAVKIASLGWKAITKLRAAEQARVKGDEKAADALTDEAVEAADELAEEAGQPRFDPKKGVYDAGWWRNKDILPKDSGSPYDVTYRSMSGDTLPTRDGQFDYSQSQLNSEIAGDVSTQASAPLSDLMTPEQLSQFYRDQSSAAQFLGATAEGVEEAISKGAVEQLSGLKDGVEVVSKEGGTPVTSANVRMAPIDKNPSRLGKPVKPAPFSNPIYDMTEGVAERAAKAKAAREAGASAGGTGTRGPKAAGEVVEGTPVSGSPVKASKNTVAVQMQSKEATEAFIKNMNVNYDTALEAFGKAFNATKMQTTEDVHAVIGQAARVLREEGVKIDYKTTHSQIQAMAIELAVDTPRLLRGLHMLAGSVDKLPEIVTASRFALATLGDQMVDLGAQVTKLVDRGENPGIALGNMQQKLAIMETIIPDLKLVRHRAAAGTMSGNIPAFSLRTAEEVMHKIRMVDGDMVTAAMLMGKMSRNDALKVVQRALRSGSWWDAIIKWRTGALLYGPKTMATNFIGTGMWGLTKPAMRVMGAMMTGNGQNVKSQARLFVGAWSAWKDSARYMKRAMIEDRAILDPLQGTYENAGGAFENLAKLYFETGKGTDAGTLAAAYVDKFSGLPMRGLVAQDELFKQMAYRSFMYQKAMGAVDLRIANGTLKESDRAAAVQKIVDDSFHPETGAGIDEEALQYAREATFTQDLGPWGQEFQRVANAIPPLRFVFPFIRTPTNLLSEAWQLTPVLNLTSKRFRAALMSQDPNQRAEALGKLAFGTTASAMAYWAASVGAINGRMPSDPDARARWLEEGRKPYSFWDPNHEKWVEYNRMDPFAAFLGLAADASILAQEHDGFDQESVFASIALSIADTIKSKSYFSGITDTLDMVGFGSGSDDQRATNWEKATGRFISSFIPNFTSQLSASEAVVETRGLLDASINKLNVLGLDVLPPKRDALGYPIMRSTGWMFGAEVPNWASPLSMGMKANNPVRSALLEAQATISKPVSKIANVDLLNYKNDKGQDAYDRLQEINSEIKLGGKTIMERLESRLPEWRERYGDLRKVQSPDNPDVTQSPIQNEIKELIADYREASRNQLFREFPEIAKAIDNSRRFKNQSGSVLNQLRN